MIKVDLDVLLRRIMELPEIDVLSKLTEDELYIKSCLRGDIEFGKINHEKLNDDKLEKFRNHADAINSSESKINSIAEVLNKIIPCQQLQDDFSFL